MSMAAPGARRAGVSVGVALAGVPVMNATVGIAAVEAEAEVEASPPASLVRRGGRCRNRFCYLDTRYLSTWNYGPDRRKCLFLAKS